jgi:hypothetical protein
MVHEGDEIDLLYVLEPHGWSTCILYIAGNTYNLSITHIFDDPIDALIESTILLLKGTAETEFLWWSEPGGNRWRITRQPAQRHRLNIILTEFSSPYHPITDEKEIVQFEIKLSHFATLVYYQMKKTACLLHEKSFKKNRPYSFPFARFHELEALMAHQK